MVMRLICTQNNRVRFLEEAQLYYGEFAIIKISQVAELAAKIADSNERLSQVRILS